MAGWYAPHVQPVETLKARFLDHNERALARAISLIEGNQEEGQTLLKAVRSRGGKARIVGLTGSPGSGKSTLADRLIGAGAAGVVKRSQLWQWTPRARIAAARFWATESV